MKNRKGRVPEEEWRNAQRSRNQGRGAVSHSDDDDVIGSDSKGSDGDDLIVLDDKGRADVLVSLGWAFPFSLLVQIGDALDLLRQKPFFFLRRWNPRRPQRNSGFPSWESDVTADNSPRSFLLASRQDNGLNDERPKVDRSRGLNMMGAEACREFDRQKDELSLTGRNLPRI